MSKLIAMRNRIKAIKTIKKITHAMRLISMSNQTKLKKQHEAITTYVESVASLFFTLKHATPDWKHPIFTPEKNNKTLRIVIGSQKGLCGSFNTNVIRALESKEQENNNSIDYIAVGKKIVQHIQKEYPEQLIISHPTLNRRNMYEITQDIISYITSAKTSYSSVEVYSNIFKNFFLQIATESVIIPIKEYKKNNVVRPPEYIWEQDKHTILNTLANQYLSAHIEYYIFQSLLSEHAARFVSMDNSTRNANTLLETTTRTYNKLRQTKITTEITELSSNF